MGKITWNSKGKDIDAIEPDERAFYDGPVPPPSVYRFKVVSVEAKTYSTGNNGIKITLDIDDPRPQKKRYNGARAWNNVIDVPESSFAIRQWLDAIGATGRDWDNTQAGPDKMVTKFGRVVVDGLYVKASTKIRKYEGNDQLDINRFLAKGADGEAENADDSDAGDDDGEPAPF